MKTIYICGDSFGVSDPDYIGASWSDKFTEMVSGEFAVVNLSTVAASNLLINLQVEKAIAENASYVICLGTSSTRIHIKTDDTIDDLLPRFFSFTRDDPYSLMSCSFLTIENYPISQNDKELIKKYHEKFFDIDLSIYENKCIIENTLQKLKDSGIPFIFDQGGFEHPSYGGDDKQYFGQYAEYLSGINLWDYVKTRNLRPYFHITDDELNEKIAKYYYGRIISTIR